MGKDSRSKKKDFFELLASQCDCLVEAGKLLQEILTADLPGRAELAKRIHEVENRSDDISHKFILRVSKSFVTPFDRTDMYEISTMLDDCIDGLDEAADLIVLYKIGELPPGMHKQLEIINKCCELTIGIPKTLAGKDKAIKDYWLGINHLENQGDKVYRRLLADIFDQVQDPMYAIKLKDLIEGLENTVDMFEKLAGLVEAIIIKES